MPTKLERCRRDGQTITYRHYRCPYEDAADPPPEPEPEDDVDAVWLAVGIGLPVVIGMWLVLFWVLNRFVLN